MLMLYSLCGNAKEIKKCMWYECYSRRGQCRRVSNEKSRKGFSTCVEEATGRLLKRSTLTEARTPDRGRCRRPKVCAVMKELIKECSVEQARLVKGQDKDRAREIVSVVAIVSVDHVSGSRTAVSTQNQLFPC
jgi:hypothetical protein